MTAKSKFNPRKMMEKAIDVMRKSINEPRSDKKASPLVGAVLFKPDGSTETAFRGELRHGDHAEYTLLERKHRDERLDGSVLFATLEPCAPGSRNHPKLSCAERIVLARIKEIWVGIEDPDPTVDRQGIKYLQDNGVKVHMFDRDLQDEIQRVNKEFISQALERARQPKTLRLPELSKLEEAQHLLTLNDLSLAALARYRAKSKMAERVGSAKFNRQLLVQGYLRRSGHRLMPTGFGVLLFGRTPRHVLPQAGLKGTIEYPNGEHEIRDFDGPMILIPDAFETWLRNKLPNVIDRSRMTRREKEALPFDSVREAVINGLVHRDYDISGASCHVVVTADAIIVKSPGPPPPPVKLEQLQSFTAPMLNRNPRLQFVFGGTKLVEGRGLGMRTLGATAAKYHVPVPKYNFDGVYLTLTIYRHAQAAVASLGKKALDSLNEDERRSWEYLSTQTIIGRKQFAQQMGFNARKAQRHLTRFVKMGLLEKLGTSTATKYKVQRQ